MLQKMAPVHMFLVSMVRMDFQAIAAKKRSPEIEVTSYYVLLHSTLTLGMRLYRKDSINFLGDSEVVKIINQ